ncbi:MAG: hypothetical protein WBB98_04455 [Xanthobacteraceae bacterium]
MADDDWRIPAFVAEHGGWQPSTNGNPMILAGKLIITVYTEFNGWKFCVGKNTNAKPYFSDSYHEEDQAKREAIAFVLRIRPIHKTRKEIRRQEGIDSWLSVLRENESALSALPEEVVAQVNADGATVTKLRPLEAQIAKRHRWSDTGADMMEQEYGMEAEAGRFRRQSEAFATLQEYVQTAIADLKARPRKRRKKALKSTESGHP